MTMIGFVGLGRMGRPMASNLVKKGFELVVYDVVPAAVDSLVDLGAARAGSAAEAAAGADIVVTMLPNSAVVEQVVLGEMLASLKQGALVMDMSTVSPETTDRLTAACAARGVGFVDAPVGRLAAHADIGQSLFMVGGSDADFARVNPLLEAMGTTIYHCGPCGTGTRTKLVNNFLAISSCQMNAEALTFAARLGLDIESTLDVIYGTTAVNGQLKIGWPAKVLAGDTAPGFTIDLAHKDLTLVIEAANAAKAPMPMAAAAREAFSQARARGFGLQDFSAMLDAHCDATGTPAPRLPHNSRHRPG